MRQVMMSRRNIGWGLGGVLVLVLAVAWADGGRRDLHLIEQPVVAQP
jgi:hypothetical protein